jgi:GDP-L-fucose synthase
VVKAAAIYNESEPVNIGTGNEIKISELLNLIARLTRFAGEIRWQSDKPDGQPRRRLDVSRAFENFGFRAQTSFEEGLTRTVEWYERSRVDTSAPEEIKLESAKELQGSLRR